MRPTNSVRSDVPDFGFTLIELLVAMVVGSLVIAGSASAFSVVTRHYQLQQIRQTVLERGQYAFASLEPEVQLAGYFGYAEAPVLAQSVLSTFSNACHRTLLGRLQLAIEFRSAIPSECRGQLRTPAADSPLLIVRRAATRLSAPDSARLAVQSMPGQMRGQVIVPAQSSPAVTRSSLSETRDLVVRAFYVSRASDGDGDTQTSALRSLSLTAIGNRPAFVDTEVMPGIDRLNLDALVDDPESTALRLELGLRSDARDRPPGQAPLSHHLTRVVTPRNISATAIELNAGAS